MTKSCRNILLMSLLASFTCGCASFWHDMQLHRLGRLNRGAPPSFNPEFSQSTRSANNRLVRIEGPRKGAEMTANRADVTLARGQSPLE